MSQAKTINNKHFDILTHERSGRTCVKPNVINISLLLLFDQRWGIVTFSAQDSCVAGICLVWRWPLRQCEHQWHVGAGLHREEDGDVWVCDVKRRQRLFVFLQHNGIIHDLGRIWLRHKYLEKPEKTSYHCNNFCVDLKKKKIFSCTIKKRSFSRWPIKVVDSESCRVEL